MRVVKWVAVKLFEDDQRVKSGLHQSYFRRRGKKIYSPYEWSTAAAQVIMAAGGFQSYSAFLLHTSLSPDEANEKEGSESIQTWVRQRALIHLYIYTDSLPSLLLSCLTTTQCFLHIRNAKKWLTHHYIEIGGARERIVSAVVVRPMHRHEPFELFLHPIWPVKPIYANLHLPSADPQHAKMVLPNEAARSWPTTALHA
jgi:hypothetical protein